MRSQLDVRLGVLEPQIVHLPPDVASLAAAEEAIELADSYGICRGSPLDESQKFTLRAGLGERADGSWAAASLSDFEPRQNGKNDTCGARELAGLLLFGERLILHTAHEFKTANESFLRMVAIFENWDDLRRKVSRIRYANGEQGIELLSGQRLKYSARTGGAGRGFAEVDLTVYDEAQHLMPEHLAASGPARLANPNSQAWFMGSGGLETSEIAWRMRRRALTGEPGRYAYVEHTAEKVAVVDGRVVSEKPDILDHAAWAQANPAYGRRITDESMSSLFGDLGADLFARECLCLWDPELGSNVDAVIGHEAWAALGDPSSHRVGDVAFAVDVTPDHAWSSIVVCGARADGLPHVELVEHRAGTEWVAGRAAELKAKHNPYGFWIDPAGPAGGLLPKLEQAGIGERPAGDKSRGFIEPVSGREHAQACAFLFEQVAAPGGFRHLGQPELAAAVDGATKRPLGDAWAWSRTNSSVDISPLVAATLALWGFNAKRDEQPASGLVDPNSVHGPDQPWDDDWDD